MTWQEVRALSDSGMDIGSHTRTHRVLDTLSADELADELGKSRGELEARLGIQIRTIAYPVGRSVADSATIRAALVKAGYVLGFTARAGVNRPFPGEDEYDLRRMRVCVGTSAEQLAGMLAFPGLAG
jgi:peptidoglycan/xylan/chitin deacetylase (PgdA/CDA1 family)